MKGLIFPVLSKTIGGQRKYKKLRKSKKQRKSKSKRT